MANVTTSPFAKLSSCEEIQCSARPSGYGCGMSSVLSAISRTLHSRCTSGASVSANGRNTSRAVVRVGRGAAGAGGSDIGGGVCIGRVEREGGREEKGALTPCLYLLLT